MRLLTLAAAAATTSLTLAAAPASAAVLEIDDQLGDVAREDEPSLYSQYGTRNNVDLASSRLRHGSDRVKLRLRYVALQPGSDEFGAEVRLRAGKDRSYRLVLSVEESQPNGVLDLERYTDDGTTAVECDGMTSTGRYETDTFVLWVPRSCLGSPAWVRYGGEAFATDTDGAHLSDALLSGDPVNGLYSARVRQG